MNQTVHEKEKQVPILKRKKPGKRHFYYLIDFKTIKLLMIKQMKLHNLKKSQIKVLFQTSFCIKGISMPVRTRVNNGTIMKHTP